LFDQVARAEPENVAYHRQKALALEALARVYEDQDRMDQAVAAQSEAQQIMTGLYKKDSTDVRICYQLASAELRQAELAGRTDRFDEAQAGYDRAIALFPRIAGEGGEKSIVPPTAVLRLRLAGRHVLQARSAMPTRWPGIAR
jgi:tetratricopeptide (TPR) repeat protein